MTIYACGHAYYVPYQNRLKKRPGKCPSCTGEAKHMPLPTLRRKNRYPQPPLSHS